MNSKRTATIRIETYEVTTIRRRPSTIRAWCSACAAEVEMLSLQRAAEWAGVPLATISEWLKTGELHMTEIAPGWIYVCRNALEQQLKDSAVVTGTTGQAPASKRSGARGKQM